MTDREYNESGYTSDSGNRYGGAKSGELKDRYDATHGTADYMDRKRAEDLKQKQRDYESKWTPDTSRDTFYASPEFRQYVDDKGISPTGEGWSFDDRAEAREVYKEWTDNQKRTYNPTYDFSGYVDELRNKGYNTNGEWGADKFQIGGPLDAIRKGLDSVMERVNKTLGLPTKEGTDTDTDANATPSAPGSNDPEEVSDKMRKAADEKPEVLPGSEILDEPTTPSPSPLKEELRRRPDAEKEEFTDFATSSTFDIDSIGSDEVIPREKDESIPESLYNPTETEHEEEETEVKPESRAEMLKEALEKTDDTKYEGTELGDIMAADPLQYHTEHAKRIDDDIREIKELLSNENVSVEGKYRGVKERIKDIVEGGDTDDDIINKLENVPIIGTILKHGLVTINILRYIFQKLGLEKDVAERLEQVYKARWPEDKNKSYGAEWENRSGDIDLDSRIPRYDPNLGGGLDYNKGLEKKVVSDEDCKKFIRTMVRGQPHVRALAKKL